MESNFTIEDLTSKKDFIKKLNEVIQGLKSQILDIQKEFEALKIALKDIDNEENSWF